jgi:hypothetical protein
MVLGFRMRRQANPTAQSKALVFDPQDGIAPQSWLKSAA